MNLRSPIINILALALLTPKPVDVDAEQQKEALGAKNPDTLSILVGSEEQILADFAKIDSSKRLALGVSDDGNAMLVIANTTATAFEVPVNKVQEIVDLNNDKFVFFHQISTVGEKANVALIDGTNEAAKAPFVMSFARAVSKILAKASETSAMFIGSDSERTMQGWLTGSDKNVEIVMPFSDTAAVRHKIGQDGILVAAYESDKYALLPKDQLTAYLESETSDVVGYSYGNLENVRIEDMSVDLRDGQFLVTDVSGDYHLATIILEEDGHTGKVSLQSTIEVDEAPAILRADSRTVITLDRTDNNGKFAVRPTTHFDSQLQDALLAAAA